MFPLRLVRLSRSCVHPWCWCALVHHGSHRLSLFFLVCPAQLVNMPHMAFCTCATAQPRIQEFDFGLIYHECLAPARSPMAALCSACRSSNAGQKVFIATTWLRSQLWVRHSSGRRGRSSLSDLHQCFVRELDRRSSDQFACADTSSLMDCGPIVMSSEALRRLDAAQRIFIAVTGLCLQFGKVWLRSLWSLPSQVVSPHAIILSTCPVVTQTFTVICPASQDSLSRPTRAAWQQPVTVEQTNETLRPPICCDNQR